MLTAAPDATNADVIQLDSASTYWGSSLVVQDMLDNTPTGQILVTPGAGGGRWITGDIDNEGLLSVAAGLEVEIDGATDAGPTFVQDGGAIRADGRLTLEGGLFDFEAGDISGSFYVDNSQIYVGPGATDAATVYVVGAYNTLLGNEGPSVTLRVEGGGDNRGVLTAAAGAVNAGSIVLGSTSSYWGSALVAPDTLLNAQGGLIAVADDGGGGTRSLVGDFLNAGTISVPENYQLSLDGATDAGPTLIQEGGLITADGGFVQDGGLFDFQSGQLTGDVAVNGAQIYVGPDVTAPSFVQVVGPNNVLLDNASVSTTLWVRGDDAYNAGVLTAAPGAGNSGTILLASVSSYWPSVLAAPDGFVNRAGAQVAAYGGGGAVALTGTVTNDGYLSLSGVGAMGVDTLVNNGVVGVDATGLSAAPGVEALIDAGAAGWVGAAGTGGAASTPADGAGGANAVTRLVVGSWTNNGVVGVDPGTQLEVAPDGSGGDAFTQAGGLVAAAGAFVVDGGLFHFSGGAVSGAFAVRDGWVRVESGVVTPSVVDVVGDSTLLDNASSAVTLDVQGGSPLGDGDAVLTAADGATNFGAIVLESLDGVHHGYFRVPAGSFTNEPGGMIQVQLPPGDSGQGSITAGVLSDDGGMSDTTGLPTLPQYQAALTQVQAAAASGGGGSGGSGGGSGGSGGGSTLGGLIDPQTWMQAWMALTPGVASGIVQVGGEVVGAAATGLSGAGDGLLDPSLWGTVATDVAGAIGGGWLYDLGDIASFTQTTDGGSASDGGVSQPWPTAPAGQGVGGAGPSDNPTGALIGSLYQLSNNLTSPFRAAVNVGTVWGNMGAQQLDLVWDVGWGLGSLASLGLTAVFGGPGPSAPPASAFTQGAVAAYGNGQLGSYLWQTASSVGSNLWNLPGNAYNAAGSAFAQFSATGDVGPLIVWAGTYGVALGGLATGGVSLAGAAEGGAALLRAADAGAAAAEAAGLPAWAGVAGALGLPDAAIAFLADESGALRIVGQEENAALAAGAPEGAVGPLTDPAQVAQADLSEAVQEGETTAENLASVGDTQAAAELVQMEEQALEESLRPGMETESAQTTITDNVQALGEQTSGGNAALEAAEQTTPAEPGAGREENATLSTGTMTPSPGSGATTVVTTSVGEYSWLQRAAAYFQNFSAIRELVTEGSLTVSTGAGGLTVALRQALFDQMAEITLATGKEVALLQMKDGSVVMVLGDAGEVSFDLNNVQSIIGHTHPSGILGLSYYLKEIAPGRFVEAGDVPVFQKLDQETTWVIGPDGTAVQFNVSDWVP